MAEDDYHNKKVPKDPWDEGIGGGNRDPRMFTRYETDTHGRLRADFSHAQQKDNFSARAHIDGSFAHERQNGLQPKDIYSAHFGAGHGRKYREKGNSDHTEGQHEDYTNQSRNQHTWKERHTTGADREAKGCTDKSCKIASSHTTLKTASSDVDGDKSAATISTEGGTNYNHGEQGNTAQTNGGDVNYDVTKDNHGKYSTGNTDHGAKDSIQIQAINGNTYITAQKKDIVINAKKSTINATAKTMITLTVGSSSIKIEQGKVTIKSPKIVLDGETHLGGEGGQIIGLCGGGCATKVFAV